MTTIRRQAASSLHGLVPFLEDILTRRLSDLELVEIDDDALEHGGDEIDAIRSEIAAIVERARVLPSDDPKLAALLDIVTQKGGMTNRRSC